MRLSICFAFCSHLEGGVDQCVVALDDQPLEESVKDGPGNLLVVQPDYHVHISTSKEQRNIIYIYVSCNVLPGDASDRHGGLVARLTLGHPFRADL